MTDGDRLIFRAARAHLIEFGWSRRLGKGPRGSTCIYVALEKSHDKVSKRFPEIAWTPFRWRELLGIEPSIVKWNDAPGRIQDEVIALFDSVLSEAAP